MSGRRALLIVDVQNDFCEGGSLAVAGGAEVADKITRYLRGHAGEYVAVVATRDWHEDPGGHFSEAPDYRDSWPAHCVGGTPGAEFHPGLDAAYLTTVVSKGRRSAAYSGFEGSDALGADLASVLRRWQVDAVDVCGLATDYCVRATAMDAAARGLSTRLLLDLCAGVDPERSAAAVSELGTAGVDVVAAPL